MKPEDVPAELVETAAEAMDTWGTGHLRRDLPYALAAVIPLIREQIARGDL